MTLAHLTHDELPVLLAIAIFAGGFGFALGVRALFRAFARRRSDR